MYVIYNSSRMTRKIAKLIEIVMINCLLFSYLCLEAKIPSKDHLLNFRTSCSKSVQSYCPSMKMIARDIFVNKFSNNFLQ